MVATGSEVCHTGVRMPVASTGESFSYNLFAVSGSYVSCAVHFDFEPNRLLGLFAKISLPLPISTVFMAGISFKIPYL